MAVNFIDDLNTVKCGGCEKTSTMCKPINYHEWARCDAYGIYTGLFCNDCYDSERYPYRKDDYHDPAYAGERLDEDY